MLFSIIVPIYNSQQYLAKCVDGLTGQTYRDIEIILVNDGSTDSSLEACRSYEKSDPRIKVVDKENGGLSDARNAGTEAAHGEYLMFVDSDDFIEKDACQRFAETAEGGAYDIIAGGAKRLEAKKESLIAHSADIAIKPMSGSGFLKHELGANNMNMAACFNIYKKDFLSENALTFEKGLFHEDELFTPRAYLKARNVISSGIVFYNYVIRDNSITTKTDKTKNARDVIQIVKTLEKEYAALEDETLKNLLNDHLVNLYLNIFQTAGLYKKQYRGLIEKEMLKGKAYSPINRARVPLFCFSPKIYYFLNYIRRKLAG